MTRCVRAAFARVVAIAFAACALAFTAAAEPQTITYWTGWAGHELAIQKRIIAAFEAENPGTSVQIMTVAGSYEKVNISFAAGNPPDLMSSVWLEDLAGYAARGVLRPLDESLAASGRDVDTEYIPGLARALRYEGRVWGLMVSASAQFLVANGALLDEAGLADPAGPRTFDDVRQFNEALVRRDVSGRLERFGWRPTPLALLGHAFGGTWYDPATGQVTADHPANVAALREVAWYGQTYGGVRLKSFESMLSGANLGYVSEIGNFAGLFSGHTGLLLTGEWSEEFIRRYGPAGFDARLFVLPAPEGGRHGAYALGGSVFVVPRDARNAAGGFRLLEYLTRPENVKIFCLGIRNMPPLKVLLDDEEFTSSPMQRLSAELLSTGEAFAMAEMPLWSYYAAELRRAEEAVLLGGADPEETLARVRADVQGRLDQLRARTAAAPEP